MFIRFHVSEFAIMGVQMANFGGQAPRTRFDFYELPQSLFLEA